MTEMTMFGAFGLMLVGLLALHTRKNPVVYAGFAVLTALFLIEHTPMQWVEHFGDHHRKHLLLNLAGMLPGFALVAKYVEISGASGAIARRLTGDGALLWSVFWLSTFLDNIAAAMIGGTILLAVYGPGNVPFKLIVAVIASSNLGGAGSPVGDTTTVMIWISGVPAWEISKAFVATIPAQLLTVAWAKRRADGSGDAYARKPHVETLKPRLLLPLLGIVGLIVGNVYEQPAIGLWAGLVLGMVLGRVRFDTQEFKKAIPNTLFLVTLVAAAELLPLHALEPVLASMGRDTVALVLGFLSAWLDNIPLTSIAINLKGFDWALLAYAVGFGGSAMWFGSSAGVAIGTTFPEAHDTRKWAGPFIAITVIYVAGFACYQLTFKVLVPLVV